MDDVNIGHFTTEYAYDALGRRIEKRHAEGTATRYVYDGSRVAEEWDVSSGGSASLSASYVYGNYIDEVLTMRRGTSDYYYHGDDQHNVVKLTDNTGSVVEAYEYGDYGQPEFYDASGALLDVSESPFGNPYLFTGRRWDEELGYYYFRNRYMDPALGRFVSRDPIGLWGDAANLGNGYTYAASNPWSLVDPLGLKSGGNIEPDDGPRNGDTLAMDSQQYGVRMPEGPDSRYAVDKANAALQTYHDTLHDQVGWVAKGVAYLPGPAGIAGEGFLAVYTGQYWALVPVVGREVVGTLNDLRRLKNADLIAELERGRNDAPIRSCFAAGTIVATPLGDKVIESLRSGDEVVTFNPETGCWTTSTATSPMERNFSGTLVTIAVAGEKIVATGEHPFWVMEGKELANRPLAEHVPLSEQEQTENGRWVDAIALIDGDILLGESGRIQIDAISKRDDQIQVYNLEIEGFHNFAVGFSGILVHNRVAAYNSGLSTLGGLRTTDYGMERLIERGLLDKADEIYRNPTYRIIQGTDGAEVFIKKRSGRRRVYDYIVVGDNGIVSALDNLSKDKLNKLAVNFEWENWF